MSCFKAACIQLTTGIHPETNLDIVSGLITNAARQGASFIATPEMTLFMDIRKTGQPKPVYTESEDPNLKQLCQLAASLKVWLLIGSIAVALPETNKYANRSFLISPDGEITARYDKIHMFDVEVDDGQSYRESNTYQAGQTAICAETPFTRLGLTICYDLRFPLLYRTLAQAGAQLLTCPAAFTRVTGEAHWHTLLRARAIETGSYLLAPAQSGRHEDGRETYGHSLIIAPWGEILAESHSTGPDIIFSEIDLSAVTAARSKIPAWSLEQNFQI